MARGQENAKTSGITRDGVLRLVRGLILWIGVGIVGLEFYSDILLVLLSIFGIGGSVGGFVGECLNRTQTSHFIGAILGGLTFTACIIALV